MMKIFDFLRAFIPQKISNKTIVWFLELMRKIDNLFDGDFSIHRHENEINVLLHFRTKSVSGFIEDQNCWHDVSFGKVNMQYAGCEIFAVYNALHALNKEETLSLDKLISEFEHDGMVLRGHFGTSPAALRDFFKKQGYRTEMVTEENAFESLSKRYETLILTMYNDKHDILKEVHTVSISKCRHGFTAHNVYCNGRVTGPYKTITELLKHINNGQAQAISLIGISKNR